MSEMDTAQFRSLLDEHTTWPDYYSFKFIAKSHQKSELLELLMDHEIKERESKNGKYTSITSRIILNSSDEVIAVYNSVSQIEGIIKL